METWKIRGLALTAYLAFVTTTCESENGGVADCRSTAAVALIEVDGRGGAGNGGVSYGIDNTASEMAYKSEVREPNRRDTSDNEKSNRKSDKKDESDKKDKSGKKHESEKKGKPEQKDKSHKKGESDKHESSKASSGFSGRSASRNYYFDDDDDGIVIPDGMFIGEDDSVIVVKTHNGVAHISSSGRAVRIEGDVKEVDVYGFDIDAVADSATGVRILSFDVDVSVRSAPSVHSDGSDSDVRWADDPMPSVTDDGAENKIRRVHPTSARQPQTANAHYHQVAVVPVESIHASQRP